MKVQCFDQQSTPAKPSPLDTSHDLNLSAELWQRALYDGLVETSRSKAFALICRARSIVDSRLAQIASEKPSYPSEALDLQNSRTYLGLLLECAGNGRGEFLWD
jgi:hypothetical protein